MIIVKQNKSDSELAAVRSQMVEKQIIGRQVTDRYVIDAMRTVPRHLFVQPEHVDMAYDDGPLPIGEGQTISQPYIVASMTEHLQLDHSSKVLEIGTGCGYQAAVLAEIVDVVYSIEIIEKLHVETNERLKRLHYRNIHLKLGDGSLGWADEEPFDAIMVTAATPKMPHALIGQLKVGGRMIVPIGSQVNDTQELMLMSKTEKGLVREKLYSVRFVPLVSNQPQA